MFSKAKIKRFNEEAGCAPPPTKYDPKQTSNPSGGYLERSMRFKENKEVTPLTYIGTNISDFTPIKKSKSGSASHLNASCASTGSSSSQSGFLSPQPFSRSKSCRVTRSKIEKQNTLQARIQTLQEEKQALQDSVSMLEEKLEKLKTKEINSTVEDKDKKLCDSATQVDLIYSQVVQDQPEDLSNYNKRDSIPVPAEELQLLRDQIDHLTMLRDNLEASVAMKDDTISDLQMQIDLIVAEAEESHEEMQVYKGEVLTLKKMLGKTCDDKSFAELHVRDLVARYETLVEQQQEERNATKEIIDQKDIEIELMSDSIETLNTQISEYGRTVMRLQSEISFKNSQVSSLEITVGDLSIATKEKEVMETVLEDEINEQNKEVNELSEALKNAEQKLKAMTKERDELLRTRTEERQCILALEEKLEALEMNLKEKEVLQQFLEKEVVSREAEVTESYGKVNSLENELKTAQQMAVDLQLHAEEQLNSVIGLKATLSVKEFDLEKKEYVICNLQEQINDSTDVQALLKNEIEEKATSISDLEKTIRELKSSLLNEEENSSQLKERVVDLTTEVTNSDAEFKQKLMAKENELEEVTLKYSDTLLEHESSRRLLAATTENLEKEKLLFEATERELESVKNDLTKQIDNSCILESKVKELNHKIIHIEDALACEEAAANEAQDKLRNELKVIQKIEENLNRENTALKSSNEGFKGQINQLKIDMTKKSVAVDHMQTRIDEFREDTNRLQATCSRLEAIVQDKEKLLSDMQNEFESRLQIITDLQDQNERKQIELKDLELESRNKESSHQQEKQKLLDQLTVVESSLKDEQEAKSVLKIEIISLEERFSCLESQSSTDYNSLMTLYEKEKQNNIDLTRKLEDLQSTYEGYEDQLNNMQTSILEKTSEVQKLEQNYMETSVMNESYREKVENLQVKINKLVQETEQLQSSLSSKDQLLSGLNQSVSMKSDEIENLQNNLEKNQRVYSSMEKRAQDLEKTIVSLKEEKDQATSQVISLQESLDVTKLQISKLNETQDLEHQLEDLREINKVLQMEANSWKSKFDNLERMVEPFRDQIDDYELERKALLSKNCAREEEVDKLRNQYAQLVGHNNHKQKIHHLIKLKKENSELIAKVHSLQMEVEKQKKTVRRLEERYETPLRRTKSRADGGAKSKVENKENTMTCSDFPQVTSTPLRSTNRYHRI